MTCVSRIQYKPRRTDSTVLRAGKCHGRPLASHVPIFENETKIRRCILGRHDTRSTDALYRASTLAWDLLLINSDACAVGS